MTRFVTVNGARLAVDEDGHGRPLLLMHAGIADRTMWDEDAQALSGGHLVIRHDHRGFGESEMPAGPFGYARDALGVLDALEVERADVLGVSMSASVALRLALDHPERVGKLVLVGGNFPTVEWTPELEALDASEEAAIARGDFDAATDVNMRLWVYGPSRGPDALAPTLRERCRAMVRRSVGRAPERARGTQEGARPTPEEIGRLRAPTLVMVGDADVPPIVESARLLEKTIPGARLVVMRGVAHLPNLERPEEFRQVLREFLD